MAIVQISKIQQRSGNLVDLPQLDEAELGFASDARKVFIGKTASGNLENIEVLTSYSDITFSQINGAVGNLNISNTVANGEILAYDGTNWINKGGASNGLITLGANSNVTLTGGTNGEVLQTDGTGNLSWTTNGVYFAEISAITQANPGVITTVNPHNFTNNLNVTITDVVGMTEVNGQAYTVTVIDSTSFSIVNTTTFTAYTSGGKATAQAGSGGSGTPGGATGQIQFNTGGIFDGDSTLAWDNTSKVLTVTGNATIGNVTSTGTHNALRYVSTATTGTAPLEINSTTRVANLNVSNSALAETVTTAAQPNITSVGTLSALSVTGNVSAGNVSGTGGVFTYVSGDGANLTALPGANVTGEVNFAATANAVAGANVSGEVTFAATANAVAGANVSGEVTFAATANAVAGANVSGTVALATTSGTVSTAAQPNITSTGTLTSLTVSGALDVLAGTLTADTLTTGANTTAGVITGNWSLSAGSRLTATYADLAEYYKGEKAYEAGTVVCFGGSAEVHVSDEKCSKRVAGVVSTNPAYLMNSTCSGIPVAVALQGRVPCKVTGKCEKGDIMVSAGDGTATAWYNVATIMQPGVVIGKSIADKNDAEESIIEIAVGRL